MVRLDLSRGFVALVDDIDGDRCNEVKWWVEIQRGRMWAQSRHSSLHKYIAGWKRVGFVNGNPLDCRRENLYQLRRVVGVYSYPLANGRWRVMVNSHTVGTAATEEEAMKKGWDMVKKARG